MIYLDHAATSWPKSPAVIRAVAQALTNTTSPSRTSSPMSRAADDILTNCRAALLNLVGAPDHTAILTTGATDALNRAIRGIAGSTRPHIVADGIAHNAVARTLYQLQARNDIELSTPSSPTIPADPGAIAQLLRPDTAMIVAVHADNVIGAINDIQALSAQCKAIAPDALLLVDAAQTVGAIPVNMPNLGADLLAFSGHKSLGGPPGTGALIANDRALARLTPTLTGGTGADSTDLRTPLGAHEAGTPNTPSFAGLLAALTHHQTGAHSNAAQYASELRDFVTSTPGVREITAHKTCDRLPTVSLTLDAYTPHEAGTILEQSFAIACRAGLHCAPEAHRALASAPAGSLRISFGTTNTHQELITLLEALTQLSA